ncbi:MAG: GTPase HflX [Dehalococcoidia bacterium]|nr:MAG: GTPase HflX [Dehalococcoidia bacterium]
MKRFNTRNTVLTRNAPERAFLVAVESRETTGRGSAKASIDELALLTGTAGASVVGRIIQKLPAPTRTHYVGKGKLEELTVIKDQAGYDVVIFDDELTPLQQRNLEETLKVKIIDRVALILDIFARRAHTREGQLQVELAQHQYLLPRLAGQWSHLERLGGGIGTRGPGESQLETDRRLISRKIHRLKAQIEEVRKHRALYRQKRLKSGIPVVSLVGYTNSGKSTLLNALCQAGVFTEGKLFATLDPTTRRLMLPDGKTILITDTVGFIRKLPPAIITAFRATLEELDEAALLLHVVDLSSPDAAEQCQTVEDILADLNLTGKPRITALNKIDLLLTDDRKWDEESAVQYLADQSAGEKAVMISATRRWGLAGLRELISQQLIHPVATL